MGMARGQGGMQKLTVLAPASWLQEREGGTDVAEYMGSVSEDKVANRGIHLKQR